MQETLFQKTKHKKSDLTQRMGYLKQGIASGLRVSLTMELLRANGLSRNIRKIILRDRI